MATADELGALADVLDVLAEILDPVLPYYTRQSNRLSVAKVWLESLAASARINVQYLDTLPDAARAGWAAEAARLRERLAELDETEAAELAAEVAEVEAAIKATGIDGAGA